MKYFNFEYIETWAKNILIEAEDEQDALKRFDYIANYTDELCNSNMDVLDTDTSITFEGEQSEAYKYCKPNVIYTDLDYKIATQRG